MTVINIQALNKKSFSSNIKSFLASEESRGVENKVIKSTAAWMGVGQFTVPPSNQTDSQDIQE